MAAHAWMQAGGVALSTPNSASSGSLPVEAEEVEVEVVTDSSHSPSDSGISSSSTTSSSPSHHQEDIVNANIDADQNLDAVSLSSQDSI